MWYHKIANSNFLHSQGLQFLFHYKNILIKITIYNKARDQWVTQKSMPTITKLQYYPTNNICNIKYVQ